MKKIIALFWILLLTISACEQEAKDSIKVIPEPQSVEYNKGDLDLNKNSRIYVSANELLPLAKILQQNILSISGLDLEVSDTKSEKNSIELILKDGYSPEEYELEIKENATLLASNYYSLALGLSTLMQIFDIEEGEITIPKLKIKDSPDYEYRAVLVDLARFWHPVEAVRETIDLLWLYKIKYLQLHLSDNRRMTFPLEDYPDLKTINKDGKREYYLREELDFLVEYAKQRGITIIPEVDLPGHSGQLFQKYPETFGSIDKSTNKPIYLYAVNIAKEETYTACAEIIRQLSEVFYTSPYIHLGGDEVYLEIIKKLPEYQDYCKENNLESALQGNAEELFCHFINRMHEVVKSCGKKTIIWEGFPGAGSGSELIPNDIEVIAWNTTYNHPDSLINNGYKIINSTWMPWYMVGAMNFAPSTERAYNWDINEFGHWNEKIKDVKLDDISSMLGAQICFWEQNHYKVVPILRDRIPILSEKLWNTNALHNYDSFLGRLNSVDKLYTNLFRPLTFSADNLLSSGDGTFKNSTTVLIDNSMVNGIIKYQISDSWDLLDNSSGTRYSEPFTVEESCIITAQLFSEDGSKLAAPTQYYLQKIDPVYSYKVYSPAPVTGWKIMPAFDTLSLFREGVAGRMTEERLKIINGELFAKVNPQGHIETRFNGINNQYAVELKGKLDNKSETGFKLNMLTHDGLAELYIDGNLAARGEDFNKKIEEFEISISKGIHDFTIKYYYRQIQNQLSLLYKTDTMTDFEAFEDMVVSLEN